MSFNYKVVEPHPTATTPYIHTARGGAGNIAKASSTTPGTDARGPASVASLNHSQPRHYTSGRGGAGNVRPISERAIFSFDEELEQQLRQERDLAPVVHVGRGGAGNKVYIDGSVRRPSSSSRRSDNASHKSTSSAESGAEIATRNIRKTLGKGWSKMVSVGDYMIG